MQQVPDATKVPAHGTAHLILARSPDMQDQRKPEVVFVKMSTAKGRAVLRF